MDDKKREQKLQKDEAEQLTVEELEERVAPAVADKKAPVPPPYPAGADYGLIRRSNLSW